MPDAGTKTIEFEGQQHVFPSDFTDTDIQKALKSHLESTSTGIVVPQGSVGDEKNSILGGAGRRLSETVKGVYHTVVDSPRNQFETDVQRGGGPPAVALTRVGEGIVAGEKEAASQVKKQFKTAKESKDPVAKGLDYARAGVTAASMLDPLATGSVTNVNKLEDENRNREAIGAGGFDALTLLIGGRTGRTPSGKTVTNKLAYATGADSIRPLEHILPDLKETIAATGKPQTVGQLATVLQDTMTRLDQQFNKALTLAKGNINTTQIADALEAKARTLPPTAEAQEIGSKLKDAAAEYRKAWTPQELNAERMYRNAKGQGFYGKSDVRQMADMRSNAEKMIDKIVADEARDVLYDEMDRQFPGQDFRGLKQKQSSLMEMQGKFNDHIEKLEAAQAKRAGAPLSEKAGISASAHPSGAGITPRMHITELLKKGPLSHADTAVKKAFGPTTGASARRATILAMPVSTLVQEDVMGDLRAKAERGELPPLQDYRDVLTTDQIGELMRIAMARKSKGKGSVQ